MLNLLRKNISFLFLISIVINQLTGMEHEERNIISEGRLVNLVVDKICEQIKLECLNTTVFIEKSAGIKEIISKINETINTVIKNINASYFLKLPIELREKIMSRFLMENNMDINDKSKSLRFEGKISEITRESLEKKLGLYRCNRIGCNKIFNLEAKFKNHKKFEHNDEDLKCEFCNLSFENMSKLRKHQIKAHYNRQR